MLVAFEGIDKLTKTTIQKQIMNRLNEIGIKTSSFDEPCKEKPFDNFYEYFKEDIDNEVLAHLFTANRLHTHDKFLKPMLKENDIVIQSRTYLSTLAYNLKENSASEKDAWAALLLGYFQKNSILEPDMILYFKPFNMTEHVKKINELAKDSIEKSNAKEFALIQNEYNKIFTHQTNNELHIAVDTSQNDFKYKILSKKKFSPFLNQDDIIEKLITKIIEQKEKVKTNHVITTTN